MLERRSGPAETRSGAPEIRSGPSETHSGMLDRRVRTPLTPFRRSWMTFRMALIS